MSPCQKSFNRSSFRSARRNFVASPCQIRWPTNCQIETETPIVAYTSTNSHATLRVWRFISFQWRQVKADLFKKLILFTDFDHIWIFPQKWRAIFFLKLPFQMVIRHAHFSRDASKMDPFLARNCEKCKKRSLLLNHSFWRNILIDFFSQNQNQFHIIITSKKLLDINGRAMSICKKWI